MRLTVFWRRTVGWHVIVDGFDWNVKSLCVQVDLLTSSDVIMAPSDVITSSGRVLTYTSSCGGYMCPSRGLQEVVVAIQGRFITVK